jgi:hypothetical protein
MDDIKELYYPFPVQVKFAQRLDDGEWSEDNWGIAFHEYIICLDCGEPIHIDDDVIVCKEAMGDDWCDLAQSIDDADEYAEQFE